MHGWEGELLRVCRTSVLRIARGLGTGVLHAAEHDGQAWQRGVTTGPRPYRGGNPWCSGRRGRGCGRDWNPDSVQERTRSAGEWDPSVRHRPAKGGGFDGCLPH
ncbi:hypothetical protein GCM10015536_22790 [Streptomyces griseomycini]|nr:hypothetical protein GCM10015536_22790 [Streptomyces griseomycini]